MTMKALVVENNPVLLQAMVSILAKEGCEVATAPNGLEALNLLKNFIPDIIFTDLIMPLIGGEQLCRIIRSNKELSTIYLVVVSGIVLEDFEHLVTEQFYDLCIAKGNLQELRRHVSDALQRLSEWKSSGGRQQSDFMARIPEGLQPSAITVELLAEKRHLNHILENLAEGIIELNPDGVVTSLNRAALKMLEVQEEAIIGSDFGTWSWGEHQERIRDWLTRQLSGQTAEQLEIREDFPVRLGNRVITASFIPVRDRYKLFGLCILRDITRQHLAEEHGKKLNDAIRLMTKMDAMSCMAGGIAHDFNNLLAVICGDLDILTHAGAGDTAEDRSRLLEHAREAAHSAVDLTRKISSSSPFGIINRQMHILEDIVENTVAGFQRDSRKEIVAQYSGERSMVSVNPEQIGAALINILRNAAEAGGVETIRVTTWQAEFAAPVIISGQYVPVGSYGCVAVQDRGQGIPREHLLNIFDPYFSTKARGALKGMGLGLAMVYATLRNHGGYVVVESTPGEGTVVTCYLPSYGGVANGAKQERPAEDERCRVMLVEHDGQAREAGRIMLEFLGHEVTAVGSLQEAVTRLVGEQEDARGKRHQVVMIDPTHENSDDHHLICSRLTEIDRDLKIIITGATVLDPVMRDCRRFGYSNALPKPFSLDSLRHVLVTALAGR